jgi:hypothetical protein
VGDLADVREAGADQPGRNLALRYVPGGRLLAAAAVKLRRALDGVSLLVGVPVIFLAGLLFDPGTAAARTAYAFGITVGVIAMLVSRPAR